MAAYVVRHVSPAVGSLPIPTDRREIWLGEVYCALRCCFVPRLELLGSWGTIPGNSWFAYSLPIDCHMPILGPVPGCLYCTADTPNRLVTASLAADSMTEARSNLLPAVVVATMGGPLDWERSCLSKPDPATSGADNCPRSRRPATAAKEARRIAATVADSSAPKEKDASTRPDPAVAARDSMSTWPRWVRTGLMQVGVAALRRRGKEMGAA